MHLPFGFKKFPHKFTRPTYDVLLDILVIFLRRPRLIKISMDLDKNRNRGFDLKYSTVSQGKIYIYIHIHVRVREKVKGSKVSQGTVPRFDRFVPPVLACVKIARVTEDGSAGG